MPSSVTFIYRGMAIEDLLQSPELELVTGEVLGLGPGIQLTPFVFAANDSAAAVAGLSSGDVYINNSVEPYRPHTVGGGGGGGGGVTKISGSATITVGAVGDGQVVALGTSILITGAIIGDAVLVGSIPALPTGIELFGKITAQNTATIEILNMSKLDANLGAFTFNASVLH